MTIPGASGMPGYGVPQWQDPVLVELRGRLRWLSEAAIDRARTVNLLDLPARLQAELARLDEPSPAMVLFAGEPSTGKTSLINALVGMPDLLPVDVDVATNSYIVVVGGDPASARVFRSGNELGEVVELTTLGEWVSEAGNPGNRKQVNYAQVWVPAPLLYKGLGTIDTPGTGSLRATHGQITLAAVRHADALVFLLDAGAPLSRPELDFLTQAAERIDTVLLLLTKTDAYPCWRQVLDEDRELLRDKAPRFADSPILPVSAKLARLAAAETIGGNAEVAAELRAESGFAVLEQQLLDWVAARRTRLRLANTARLTAAALEQIAAAYAARAATLSGDLGPLQRLETAQAQLDDQTSRAQTWRAALNEAFSRLDQALNSELQANLADLRSHFETEIATTWRRGRQQTLAAEVEADLARLRLQLQHTAAERAIADVDAQATQLHIDDLQVRAGELALPKRDRPTARPPQGMDAATGLSTAQSLLSSSIGAVGVVHTSAALLGALATPLVLLGSVLTWLAGLARISGMHRAAEQQEARRLLTEILAQFERDAGLALNDLLRELGQQAEQRIGQELQQRLTTTQAQVRELIAAATKASRSQAERTRLQAAQSEVNQLVQECQNLIAELTPPSGDPTATI